ASESRASSVAVAIAWGCTPSDSATSTTVVASSTLSIHDLAVSAACGSRTVNRTLMLLLASPSCSHPIEQPHEGVEHARCLLCRTVWRRQPRHERRGHVSVGPRWHEAGRGEFGGGPDERHAAGRLLAR